LTTPDEDEVAVVSGEDSYRFGLTVPRTPPSPSPVVRGGVGARTSSTNARETISPRRQSARCALVGTARRTLGTRFESVQAPVKFTLLKGGAHATSCHDQAIPPVARAAD
jgi:hypothetical protein